MRIWGFWDMASRMSSTQLFFWKQVKLDRSLLRYSSNLHGSYCILLIRLFTNLSEVHRKFKWLQILCPLLFLGIDKISSGPLPLATVSQPQGPVIYHPSEDIYRCCSGVKNLLRILWIDTSETDISWLASVLEEAHLISTDFSQWQQRCEWTFLP